MALLRGSDCARIECTRSRNSGNPDGLRAPKCEHLVQGMNGDGDLRRTTPIRPRAQPVADYSFEAADGRLRQSPTGVPRRLLPAPASMLDDALEMPIALGWGDLYRLAQSRR